MPPVYGLGKRGQPTLLVVVQKAATGVFNSFSAITPFVEGADEPEQHDEAADAEVEGGAGAGPRAKKKNQRQRREELIKDAAAGRWSTGWWWYAAAGCTLFSVVVVPVFFLIRVWPYVLLSILLRGVLFSTTGPWDLRVPRSQRRAWAWAGGDCERGATTRNWG